MDISSPYNTKHITHVGYDENTGEFTGLPREWHTLLKASGITQTEQEQNPQVRRTLKKKNLFSRGIYILTILLKILKKKIGCH